MCPLGALAPAPAVTVRTTGMAAPPPPSAFLSLVRSVHRGLTQVVYSWLAESEWVGGWVQWVGVRHEGKPTYIHNRLLSPSRPQLARQGPPPPNPSRPKPNAMPRAPTPTPNAPSLAPTPHPLSLQA